MDADAKPLCILVVAIVVSLAMCRSLPLVLATSIVCAATGFLVLLKDEKYDPPPSSCKTDAQTATSALRENTYVPQQTLPAKDPPLYVKYKNPTQTMEALSDEASTRGRSADWSKYYTTSRTNLQASIQKDVLKNKNNDPGLRPLHP